MPLIDVPEEYSDPRIFIAKLYELISLLLDRNYEEADNVYKDVRDLFEFWSDYFYEYSDEIDEMLDRIRNAICFCQEAEKRKSEVLEEACGDEIIRVLEFHEKLMPKLDRAVGKAKEKDTSLALKALCEKIGGEYSDNVCKIEDTKIIASPEGITIDQKGFETELYTEACQIEITEDGIKCSVHDIDEWSVRKKKKG